MTELEVLVRDITGLTELLRVAWTDVANPLLTPLERRESCNEIYQYSAELRCFLVLMKAELCRDRSSQERPAKRDTNRRPVRAVYLFVNEKGKAKKRRT